MRELEFSQGVYLNVCHIYPFVWIKRVLCGHHKNQKEDGGYWIKIENKESIIKYFCGQSEKEVMDNLQICGWTNDETSEHFTYVSRKMNRQ